VTKLTRPVAREVELYGVGPVAVVMDADTKSFFFREKGCQTNYRIPMMTAYLNAIKTDKKEK
jgi:hypothetical protein